jgi:hypothetical protein
VAEDPRLFVLKGRVYALFTTRQGQQITPFDKFEPVLLKFNATSIREKNWAPFVVDDTMHFVYTYDPLVVLYYDFNEDGLLKVAFCDPRVARLPYDTAKFILRGRFNLGFIKGLFRVADGLCCR